MIAVVAVVLVSITHGAYSLPKAVQLSSAVSQSSLARFVRQLYGICHHLRRGFHISSFYCDSAIQVRLKIFLWLDLWSPAGNWSWLLRM